MADRLRELLPSWARQEDELDYGGRLAEPATWLEADAAERVKRAKGARG